MAKMLSNYNLRIKGLCYPQIPYVLVPHLADVGLFILL